MGESGQQLECDYLVVGAGCSSLSFVDALLARFISSKKNVSIVIVDERGQPGGHWNDAYAFAKLHHESSHYGVSSKLLEPEGVAKPGKKRRHYASTDEILVYFNSVMDDLVSTGFVRYFPKCSVRDDEVVSLMEPNTTWKVSSTCKIVDSTFLRVQSPSVRLPPFEIGVGALVVPPNFLSSVPNPPSKYVVLGAGRTAIDVIMWLLETDLDPSKIQWVMPRDHWFMCREAIEGSQVVDTTQSFIKATMNSISLEGLTLELERKGLLCRLDPLQKQESFHGAALPQDQLHQLRRIKDIVRLGRVRAVHADHMLLERGTVPTLPGTLFVDCTSTWIPELPEPVRIFQPNVITLQPVQELFVQAGEFNVPYSAGLLGVIEALFPKDDGRKNAWCTPARYPDTLEDWYWIHITSARNRKLWEHPFINTWLMTNRLSLFCDLAPPDYSKFREMLRATSSRDHADVLEQLLKKAEAARTSSAT